MREWKAVGVVSEGQPIRFSGINPWNHKWNSVEDPHIELPHPNSPHQKHKMLIYVIEADGCSITFAAGELSANVWGFYVPV